MKPEERCDGSSGPLLSEVFGGLNTPQLSQDSETDMAQLVVNTAAAPSGGGSHSVGSPAQD